MRSETHWGRPESGCCSDCRPSNCFITVPLKKNTKTAEPQGSAVKGDVQGDDICLKFFIMLVCVPLVGLTALREASEATRDLL
jgi:hypothetical protein